MSDPFVVVRQQSFDALLDAVGDQQPCPLVVVAEVLHRTACIDQHVGVFALDDHDDGSVRAALEQHVLGQSRFPVKGIGAQVAQDEQRLLLHLYRRIHDQPREERDPVHVADLGAKRVAVVAIG